MKQQYKNTNFKPETLALIRQVEAIVDEYLADGFRMTVRQVYYQCIARDIFPASWIDEAYNRRKGLAPDTKNTVKNYKRLAGTINDGKLAGLLDWEAIEDITREFTGKQRWESVQQFIDPAMYHEDLWNTQETRVFVVVEKDALLGVLKPTCFKLDIPLMAARGYASGTVLREFVLRDVVPTLEGGQDAVILHLGDHDPSGIDMTRDIDERVQLFTSADTSGSVVIRRIALNMDQIDELKPPENPAKTSDPRFEGYRQKYGDASWELDALKPTYIDRLVRREAGRYMNVKAFEKRAREVEAQRKRLQEVLDNWNAEE